VAVASATAQVLVGDSAAIPIQALVILRLWEFDSPRPHKKFPETEPEPVGQGEGGRHGLLVESPT